MRTVLQRVSRAEVRVEGVSVGRIDRGLLLLVGVAKGDTEADADATVKKIASLRCFPGRTPLDLTLAQVGGSCLVISQFTLLADLAHGNRPGFDAAESPALAASLYLRVADGLRSAGLPVSTGRFGATMAVDLINDGPVTLLLDVRNGRLLSSSP